MSINEIEKKIEELNELEAGGNNGCGRRGELPHLRRTLRLFPDPAENKTAGPPAAAEMKGRFPNDSVTG